MGKREAQHRKYERLELGGGHAYVRSSVSAVVIIRIRHNLLHSARTKACHVYRKNHDYIHLFIYIIENVKNCTYLTQIKYYGPLHDRTALSSQDGPRQTKALTSSLKKMSNHKSQKGLEAKTD
jgi:hypothetical protein